MKYSSMSSFLFSGPKVIPNAPPTVVKETEAPVNNIDAAHVPVFHTAGDQAEKPVDPFAETLFPTSEPVIHDIVPLFTTPKTSVSEIVTDSPNTR